MAACLIRSRSDLCLCFVSRTPMSHMCQRCVCIPGCPRLRMVLSLGRCAAVCATRPLCNKDILTLSGSSMFMRVYTSFASIPLAVGQSVGVKPLPIMVQMCSPAMEEILALNRRIATPQSVRVIGLCHSRIPRVTQLLPGGQPLGCTLLILPFA